MATKKRNFSWPAPQRAAVAPRKRNATCTGYVLLLSSITNDLDLMLSDLCKTFPYPSSIKSPGLIKDGTSNSGLFESHMGLLDEDGSMESLDGEKALHHSGIFQLEDLDQDCDSVGSDTPVCPTPPPMKPGFEMVHGETEPVTVLERLIRTHPVWYLPNIGRAGTVTLLQHQPIGTFLVRQSSKKDTMALSVRQNGDPAIEHYLIECSCEGLRLEGSFHNFSAMPLLIAYYVENLDELPVRLLLPPAIANARSLQELTSLALLGQDFWTSKLMQTTKCIGNKTMPLYPTSHIVDNGRRISQSSDAGSYSSEDNTGRESPFQTGRESPFQMLSDLDLLVNENIQEFEKNKQNIIASSKKSSKTSHSTENHRNIVVNGFSKSSVATVNTAVTKATVSKSISHQHQSARHSAAGHVNIPVNTDVTSKILSSQSSKSEFSSKLKTLATVKDSETFCNGQSSTVKIAESRTSQTPAHLPVPSSKKKPWTPNAAYFEGSLADRMSDYEDIWNSPLTTPSSVDNKKQHFLFVQNPNFDIKSNKSAGNRTSLINPCFQSEDDDDNDSLSSSRDPSIFEDSEDCREAQIPPTTESEPQQTQEQFTESISAENTGTIIRQHKLKDNTHVFSFDFFLPPSPPKFDADGSLQTPCTRGVSPPLATSTANRTTFTVTTPPLGGHAFSSPSDSQPFESRVVTTIADAKNSQGVVSEKDRVNQIYESPTSPNRKTPPPIPARRYKSPPKESVDTFGDVFKPQRKEPVGADVVTRSEAVKQPAVVPALQQRPPPSPTPAERRKKLTKKHSSASSKSHSFRAGGPNVTALRQADSKNSSLPSGAELTRKTSERFSRKGSEVSRLNVRMNRDGCQGRQSPRSTPERGSLVDSKADVTKTTQTAVARPDVILSGSALSTNDNSSTAEKKLSDSFEDDYFSVSEEPLVEDDEAEVARPVSPIAIKFPKHVTDARPTSFSDMSTVEDLISDMSPELTVRPIKPLTQRNLQRMSDYDNIGGSFRPASSAGTEFCKPWDSSIWANLLGGMGDAPPRQSIMTNPPPSPPAPPILTSGLSPEFSKTLQQWKENNKDINLEDGDSEPDYSSIYQDSPQGEQKTFHHTLDLGCDIAASFEWHRPDLMFGTSPPKDIPMRPISVPAPTCAPPPPPRDLSSHVASKPIPVTGQAQPGLLNNAHDNGCRADPPAYQRDELFSDEEPFMDDDHGITESFKDRLMPFLGSSRLLSLKSNKVNNPVVKVRDFVSRLSLDKSTTFGITIQNFIQCTQEGAETNPNIVMRNVRQFMNGIKNYLVKHGEDELNFLIEQERGKLESDEFLNIDAIIENALHRCVIKPLKQHIYKLFVDEYSRNGNLKQLSENIKYARTKTPEDMGIKPELVPPQGTSLEVIKHFLSKMQKAYSPLKKLENLLGAISSIYNSVEGMNPTKNKRGDVVSVGADDFLPIVIYVLVHSGLVAAEIEADYMWGLLHPSLLAGEGGYYLTTLSSAVHVLKNFRDMFEAQPITAETRLPSIGDLNGFMKIMIPDEQCDSIITKTLPVRPNMPARDVCSMIAHKFKITNPQDYGLYQLQDGVETKLADNQCPQNMKEDVHAVGNECFFTYKRNNAKFVWPVSLRK